MQCVRLAHIMQAHIMYGEAVALFVLLYASRHMSLPRASLHLTQHSLRVTTCLFCMSWTKCMQLYLLICLTGPACTLLIACRLRVTVLQSKPVSVTDAVARSTEITTLPVYDSSLVLHCMMDVHCVYRVPCLPGRMSSLTDIVK